MRSVAVVMTLAMLGACVRASVEMMGPATYPPISPDSVTVFMDATELQADSIIYERIALIFLKGDQTFTDQQAMIRKAREKAAEIGANGIVIGGIEEGQYDAFWGVQGDRQGRAMAVRWRIVQAEEPGRNLF